MPLMFSMSNAENGQRFLSAFAGGKMHVADDSHPNFKAIVGACQSSMLGEPVDETEFASLFDIAAQVTRAFERLSQRVTVEGDSVLFDGDLAQPGLSKQIIRLMDDGEDFSSLVNFMEKIETNPNDHSKQQAWDWLNNHDFTITTDGDVVAYKGVYSDGNGGYRSGHRGNAMVNDRKIENDYVPNAVGDIITMPRSEVAHDPAQACHVGLHVGTFAFAKSWAQGAMLKVLVDPRDIVSVPTDAQGAKIRVCRYSIDSIIDAPDTKSVYRVEEYTEDDGSLDDEPEFAFAIGDEVVDMDGDRGSIKQRDEDDFTYLVNYGDSLGCIWMDEDDLHRA